MNPVSEKFQVSANRFMLHASAVITPVGVVLFSGPSRAGKSTMASLVSRHTGWPIMADDTVWVNKCGDVWNCEDAGFTVDRLEHNRCACNESITSAPICIWFSVYKARQPACMPLAPSETCAKLVQAWLEVAGHSSPYDPVCGLRFFQGAAVLAKAIRAMDLYCTLETDTVWLILEIVGKKMAACKSI